MNPPAAPITWRPVDSSAIAALGWDSDQHMYCLFRARGLFRYDHVSRQRVVAAASAPSVGRYVNERIIPNYPAWHIVSRPERLDLHAGDLDDEGGQRHGT